MSHTHNYYWQVRALAPPILALWVNVLTGLRKHTESRHSTTFAHKLNSMTSQTTTHTHRQTDRQCHRQTDINREGERHTSLPSFIVGMPYLSRPPTSLLRSYTTTWWPAYNANTHTHQSIMYRHNCKSHFTICTAPTAHQTIATSISYHSNMFSCWQIFLTEFAIAMGPSTANYVDGQKYKWCTKTFGKNMKKTLNTSLSKVVHVLFETHGYSFGLFSLPRMCCVATDVEYLWNCDGNDYVWADRPY